MGFQSLFVSEWKLECLVYFALHFDIGFLIHIQEYIRLSLQLFPDVDQEFRSYFTCDSTILKQCVDGELNRTLDCEYFKKQYPIFIYLQIQRPVLFRGWKMMTLLASKLYVCTISRSIYGVDVLFRLGFLCFKLRNSTKS